MPRRPTFAALKRLVSILLSVCLLCQCMVQLGLVAWYELNKTYIASVFCENKSKPELKCCGQCYLRKQMRKAEGEHKTPGKNTPAKVQKTEIPEFMVSEQLLLVYAPLPEGRGDFPAGRSWHVLFRPADALFHPPPAVSSC